MRELRQVNRALIEQTMNRFLSLTQRELMLVIADEDTPLLELMVAKVALAAIVNGDEKRLDYIVTRLVGKTPEAPRDINLNIRAMPQARLIAMSRQAIALLEAKGIEAPLLDESQADDRDATRARES